MNKPPDPEIPRPRTEVAQMAAPSSQLPGCPSTTGPANQSLQWVSEAGERKPGNFAEKEPTVRPTMFLGQGAFPSYIS